MITLTGLYLITELPANPWEIVAMIKQILGFFFLIFLAGVCTTLFAYSMHGFAFNFDGSMSKHVVVIPAMFLSVMIIFFSICISELREANENLTTLNKNIVAIYKQNKDHISFK